MKILLFLLCGMQEVFACMYNCLPEMEKINDEYNNHCIF